MQIFFEIYINFTQKKQGFWAKLLLKTCFFSYKLHLLYRIAFNFLLDEILFLGWTNQKLLTGKNLLKEKAKKVGLTESVAEVKNYETNMEKELPILKWQREILWRNYNKSVNENDKCHILKEINQLTEKIDISHAQKNACIRIINKYAQ